MYIPYSPSNRTRKEASVKKIAFLLQTVKKQNFFFIYSKKLCFSGHSWFPLKPSLRSGFKAKPFEARKTLFSVMKKNNYCFLPVFREKNTIVIVCTVRGIHLMKRFYDVNKMLCRQHIHSFHFFTQLSVGLGQAGIFTA